MKVLLKQDVDNLGYAGEVYKVAAGYGRNYLIPQGYAVLATPEVLHQAEHWRKKAEVRRIELQAQYAALAERIEAASLSFTARAGDSGKLYGSITTAQITDDLNELLGTEIDRRKVGTEPLRQLGEHQVVVRLSSDFQPKVTVIIESEDQIAEAEALEEIAEEAAEAVADVEALAAAAQEELVEDVAEVEEALDDFEDEYDDYLDETS